MNSEKLINLTFDLETLGNTSNAPIVQIGAVKFLDNGTILDKFVNYISLEKLERYKDKFSMDLSTIQWWFSQDDKAIKSVMCPNDGIDLRLALRNFHDWIGKPSEYNYFSHATFDPPILNNNFIAVGLKNPIPFRNHRDIRTLTHFAGKVEVFREGIHHNALDDCLYQVEYISKSIQIIKNLGKTD